MSPEQMSSDDSVRRALTIEGDVDTILEASKEEKNPPRKLLKDLRSKMEEWVALMDGKTQKQYEEELAGLPAGQAKAEMLIAIHARFPKVAKELGWYEGIGAEYQNTEMAA